MTSQPQGSWSEGDDLTLRIQRVSAQPIDEGRMNLTIETSRGDIEGILHPQEGSHSAVIWVCGAMGGLDGPADGIYGLLGDRLLEDGITSLRLNYRYPNMLPDCTLDILAGVSFFQRLGAQRIALVGHSFGGAVVIMAGAFAPEVSAVVALSSQTAGAGGAGKIAPRPLLLIHGAEDARLPPDCSRLIHEWADEPKELIILPGAGHSLRECESEVRDLLRTWLVEKLAPNRST